MQIRTKWIAVLGGLSAMSGLACAEISALVPGTAVPNRAPLQMNAFNPLPLGVVKISEHAIGDTPFDMQQPAVTLQLQARELPQWTVYENSAGPLPVSAVRSDAALRELTLIPYGAAKLRITAFPYLNERSKCNSTTALVKTPIHSTLE